MVNGNGEFGKIGEGTSMHVSSLELFYLEVVLPFRICNSILGIGLL
jgi:hypothetical protein